MSQFSTLQECDRVPLKFPTTQLAGTKSLTLMFRMVLGDVLAAKKNDSLPYWRSYFSTICEQLISREKN